MTYRKLYIWGAVGIAVAALLTACVFWTKHLEPWGEFPADARGPAPLVQVEAERDFGHRTGDAIPVTIYIRQFPGTSIDVDGLALDGDFEIRGDVQVDSRATADGGRITRVKMSVQSFNFKPVVSARVSMTWNKTGEKDWNEIDKVMLSLHTSPTYDGREKIQEGRLDYVQGLHLLYTMAWIVIGIAGIVLATLYIRRELRNLPPVQDPPRKLTLYEWAALRFDRVWARIRRGDRSDAVFQEIDYITRRLLHVETVQISYLEYALYNHPFKKQGLYIIKTCERRLFRGDKLSERHIMQLKTAFDAIVGAKLKKNEDGETETV